MVYSGAIDCIIGRPPPAAGDAVMVVDHAQRPIAWGVYNDVSMFRVRIMQVKCRVDTVAVCWCIMHLFTCMWWRRSFIG